MDLRNGEFVEMVEVGVHRLKSPGILREIRIGIEVAIIFRQFSNAIALSLGAERFVRVMLLDN